MSDTRLVLLGTAGGPLPSALRCGIAQAIVVSGRVYLVDCGTGVARQLRRARLLGHLHTVLLTHLHSDHDCDYFNLFLQAWPVLDPELPIAVHGPGRAGVLPPVDAGAPAGRRAALVHPANPTPGIADITTAQIAAHAYDLNIRMREAGRCDLTQLIAPREIALRGADEPLLVFEDERVRVTAILVDHAPVFPAFAYRFDTDEGSIVISGDTAPCASLIALARGADLLVHEVYDDSAPGQESEGWEDEQRERHRVRSHTPLSAIGRIAAECGARRVVLTHFLPGDDALPDEHWVGALRASFDGIAIAGRDLLEVAL